MENQVVSLTENQQDIFETIGAYSPMEYSDDFYDYNGYGYGKDDNLYPATSYRDLRHQALERSLTAKAA